MIVGVAIAAIGIVVGIAIAASLRAGRVVPLTVSMGEGFAAIRERFGAGLDLVERLDTSWTVVTRRHRLTITLPTGPYALPVSRHTALDFTRDRLDRVLTNPHDEALSLDDARALTDALCRAFSDLGFEVHRAPFPEAEWIEPLRRAEASRPERDVAHFRADPMLVGVTLQLLHWRGAPSGSVGRAPPGLAFVIDLFTTSRAPDDRWLLTLSFLATDLARPDHLTALGFERFRRKYGDGPALEGPRGP